MHQRAVEGLAAAVLISSFWPWRMVTCRLGTVQVPYLADHRHAVAMMVVGTHTGALMIAAAQFYLQLGLGLLLGNTFCCPTTDLPNKPQQERRCCEHVPAVGLAELCDRSERLVVYALGPGAADHVGHRVTALPHTPHIPSQSLLN